MRGGLKLCWGDEGGSRAEAAHRRLATMVAEPTIAILRRVDGRIHRGRGACLRLRTSLDRGAEMRRPGAQETPGLAWLELSFAPFLNAWPRDAALEVVWVLR